jgi:hypothetical protein
MKRQDLLTNEEFVPSRINQKFAKAQNRIKFYNDRANEFRHSIAYISKPLYTNIKILNELMRGKKEATFHKQYLLGKGFTIGLNTHIEQYDNKNLFAIHKYIILPLANEQIKIITNGGHH